MSNNQMVSVPRGTVENAAELLQEYNKCSIARDLRALLAQPADQHQGEPVGEVVAFGKGLHEIAWAAGRMPKLGAKLYTSADPAEVERLRDQIVKLQAGFYQQVVDSDLKKIADYVSNPDLPKGAFLRRDAYDLANMCMHMVREVQASRIKLAERDALLKRCEDSLFNLLCFGVPEDRTEADQLIDQLRTLSVSAEPSASVEPDCKDCNDTGLRSSQEPPFLDVVPCTSRGCRAALERKP